MTQPRRRTKTRGPATPTRGKLGAKALSVLMKPARLELYESLQVGGPASVADLAQRLGRPADSLYYHVKKLLAVGVIQELADAGEGRSGPGRRGAVFSIVSRRLDAELDADSPASRDAWSDGARSLLRLAQRDFCEALDSGEARPKGVRRNVMLWRVKARLTPSKLKEVNQHIDALHDLLFERAEATQGELHAVTCVMTPLEERSQR